MALTKCAVSTDVIGTLGTTVAERGLTTQQFKDKFDEMPEGIKTYLNDTLTEELDTALAVTASETVAGKVELATAAETTTGTDDTRAVHPKGLKVELDKKLNLAGGTMTGALVAGNNTDYTTAQARNIILSTSDASGGAEGDVWIKYTA
jgi:hypothetical protein